MKDFEVMVDITMSKCLHVSAESEDDARSIVENKFNNPYDVAYGFDAYVGHEITSVEVESRVEPIQLL